MVYFVSRHQGAIEWMKAQPEWAVDCFITHLDTARLKAGDVVIGTLPLHLAEEVCAKGAAFYFLQLPQQEARRGTEYTAAEMQAVGCRLRRFEVNAV